MNDQIPDFDESAQENEKLPLCSLQGFAAGWTFSFPLLMFFLEIELTLSPAWILSIYFLGVVIWIFSALITYDLAIEITAEHWPTLLLIQPTISLLFCIFWIFGYPLALIGSLTIWYGGLVPSELGFNFLYVIIPGHLIWLYAVYSAYDAIFTKLEERWPIAGEIRKFLSPILRSLMQRRS